MMVLERLWRAAAALVAGAWIALDHLRDTPDPELGSEASRASCPECFGSLAAGPHFHGSRAYWACEDDDFVLVTDNRGGVPS